MTTNALFEKNKREQPKQKSKTWHAEKSERETIKNFPRIKK
jgi:hypothetical protein